MTAPIVWLTTREPITDFTNAMYRTIPRSPVPGQLWERIHESEYAQRLFVYNDWLAVWTTPSGSLSGPDPDAEPLIDLRTFPSREGRIVWRNGNIRRVEVP